MYLSNPIKRGNQNFQDTRKEPKLKRPNLKEIVSKFQEFLKSHLIKPKLDDWKILQFQIWRFKEFFKKTLTVNKKYIWSLLNTKCQVSNSLTLVLFHFIKKNYRINRDFATFIFSLRSYRFGPTTDQPWLG